MGRLQRNSEAKGPLHSEPGSPAPDQDHVRGKNRGNKDRRADP